MKEFWDERYAEKDYAYGEEPNAFFKEKLDALKPGRLLLPADGEGRNSVYAASKQWEVDAFDISNSGRKKALELARRSGVDIAFNVGPLEEQDYAPESFDAIALIFAHFSPDLKASYHAQFVDLLKPGGHLIFEAFSKNHLKYNSENPEVGGPKNADLLYDVEELCDYFQRLEDLETYECEVNLSEGTYHKGIGSVVRFVGKKK
jgi:cyclopropane fatty-acyl-phospholipid synthase-like methyltransferase